MSEGRTWWDDDPIVLGEIDDLQRLAFATSLAGIVSEIGDSKSSNSTVIGLTGPWGSGKTSTVTTAVDQLDKDMWRVQWLNPWALSGAEAVTHELVASIAAALPPGNAHQQLRDGLYAYGGYATPLVSLIPFIGGLGSSALDKVLSSRRDTVDQQAKQLADRLKTLRQRILIVVDDLDRLQPDDLLAILKGVRAVGRLPNVHYLLAYDPETLKDVLTHTAIAAGNPDRALAYLEKVVTIRLDQPPTTDAHTDALLRQGLPQALALVGSLTDDQTQRLDIECRNLFIPLLREPRRVRRFLSQLRCYLPLVGADQVDPVDFAVLCLIRLSYPSLYTNLNDERHLLCGAVLDLNDRLVPWRSNKRVSSLVADERIHEALAEAIGRLFPVVVGQDAVTVDVGLRRRDRRVSDPDCVDRYFALNRATEAFPELILSRALVQWARPSEPQLDGATILDALNDGRVPTEQRQQILRGLSSRTGDVSPEDASRVLVSLLSGLAQADASAWRSELNELVGSLLVRVPDQTEASVVALGALRQLLEIGAEAASDRAGRLGYSALVGGIRSTTFARQPDAPRTFLADLGDLITEASWRVIESDLLLGVEAPLDGSDQARRWLEEFAGDDALDRRLISLLNDGIPLAVLAAHFVVVETDPATGTRSLGIFNSDAFGQRFAGHTRVDSQLSEIQRIASSDPVDTSDVSWGSRVRLASKELIKWHSRTRQRRSTIPTIDEVAPDLLPLRGTVLRTSGDELPDLQVAAAFALGGRVAAPPSAVELSVEEQESHVRFQAQECSLDRWFAANKSTWHLNEQAAWLTREGAPGYWSEAHLGAKSKASDSSAAPDRVSLRLRVHFGVTSEGTPAIQVSAAIGLRMQDLDNNRERSVRRHSGSPLPSALTGGELLSLVRAVLAAKEVAFDLWTLLTNEAQPRTMQIQLGLHALSGIDSVMDLRHAHGDRLGTSSPPACELTYDFVREPILRGTGQQGPMDIDVSLAALSRWAEQSGFRGVGQELADRDDLTTW